MMISARKVTPAIGAELMGIDFSKPLDGAVLDAIYQALLDHLVIFIRGTDISPAAHLAFAESFGDLDAPHLLYPHVEGFENIMLLKHGAKTPPDTNVWHTDLTYKAEQPFASILVAREVPDVGGDTMWASLYAAYDRLPGGMRRDLEGMEAIHDMGDFRNSFVSSDETLNDAMARFGQTIRPLIGTHPVTGRKFLNFNEGFVSHIVGLNVTESNALKAWLTSHMAKPEDQMRWRWQAGDLAMWDNRVTMHYAVADYLPHPREMNRITVIRDRRAAKDAAVA